MSKVFELWENMKYELGVVGVSFGYVWIWIIFIIELKI